MKLETAVKKVANQTDINDHNGSLLTIANYVASKHNQLDGVEKFASACRALITLHGHYGHMPRHLQQVREDLSAGIFSMLNENEAAAFNAVL